MRTLAQIINWTDYAGDSECDPRSKPLTQRGGDVFFFIHHAYNRLIQDTIALSKPGGKQVSENVAIGPTVAGAESPIYVAQVVPWNTHRAYTTASSKDDIAFTTEVSNINLNYPYPVAQAAKYLLAEIAAALHVETGMPLDTWHVCDHAAVYARGWGSYATACCGDDLRAAIGWIIEEAKRIVAGATMPAPEEEEKAMQFYTINGGGLNGVSVGVYPGGFTVFESNFWRDKMLARYEGAELQVIAAADLDDELRRLGIPPEKLTEHGWNVTRTPPVPGFGSWSRDGDNATKLDDILAQLNA